MRTIFSQLALLAVLSACSGQNVASVDAGAQVGGSMPTGGAASPGGSSSAGGATPATGGSVGAGGSKASGGAPATGGTKATGGVSATGGTTSATTSQGGTSVILYGSPYVNVNMWYGPVDFAESQYHNACGLEDGTIYPTVIQDLYGNYLIGLDGGNIPNVASHCDDCAQLTANGKTIVAHIITYGTENGVDAIDLSPEAQSALGLSSSDWTGTWQFCSCLTNGTPIYYEFDSRQWNPQNFWYMRIWTRNQHLPVTLLETKIGSAAWAAASQADDGAWETVSGVDFSGGFQVRVTAVDNQQMVDTIPAPPGINPANPIAGHANFNRILGSGHSPRRRETRSVAELLCHVFEPIEIGGRTAASPVTRGVKADHRPCEVHRTALGNILGRQRFRRQ